MEQENQVNPSVEVGPLVQGPIDTGGFVVGEKYNASYYRPFIFTDDANGLYSQSMNYTQTFEGEKYMFIMSAVPDVVARVNGQQFEEWNGYPVFKTDWNGGYISPDGIKNLTDIQEADDGSLMTGEFVPGQSSAATIDEVGDALNSEDGGSIVAPIFEGISGTGDGEGLSEVAIIGDPDAGQGNETEPDSSDGSDAAGPGSQDGNGVPEGEPDGNSATYEKWGLWAPPRWLADILEPIVRLIESAVKALFGGLFDNLRALIPIILIILALVLGAKGLSAYNEKKDKNVQRQVNATFLEERRMAQMKRESESRNQQLFY
jgi:hypothetical protein